MNRRNFLETSAAMAAAAAAAQSPAKAAPAKAAKSKPMLMKLGTQNDDSEAALKVFSALGVLNICSRVPSAKFDAAWSVEGLKKLRERVESHGIVLDAVPLPLSSSYITKSENPNIMLGKSPERDREIDNICQMIRNAAQAGIPILKYNMTILGVVRSEATKGRGASMYSTFRYAEAKQDPPLTEAGPVSAEQMWERITYFLNRVIPVANEYKIRMACHPHDPGMPEDVGFRGVHRVLGNVAGLKKFVSIQESPYHGLNFCQGTVSEMLKDPNNELPDVIRYFGTRRKIFNVHFRNIKGGFLNFQETLPDAGDVDFVKIVRVYREVGYDGLLMPDHVPKIEGDAGSVQAFAFCFGYISALIQAVGQEA
jgi:mannonate dehydratase